MLGSFSLAHDVMNKDFTSGVRPLPQASLFFFFSSLSVVYSHSPPLSLSALRFSSLYSFSVSSPCSSLVGRTQSLVQASLLPVSRIPAMRKMFLITIYDLEPEAYTYANKSVNYKLTYQFSTSLFLLI